jgi:O-antigen/teichoic acid export membrane protein
MRHSVLLVIPTAVSLVAIVLLIPLVYGSGFDRSVVLGFILIPGVVVVGVAKVMSAVVTGRGFPRYALFATIITVPVSVGLSLLLIPPLHAVGAAIASSISYAITLGLSLPILRRATPIRLRDALVPTRADVTDYLTAFRLARTHLHRA